MKDEILTVASLLEDVQRDLSYLDPEDIDSELPEIVDRMEAAIMRLVAVADQIQEAK